MAHAYAGRSLITPATSGQGRVPSNGNAGGPSLPAEIYVYACEGMRARATSAPGTQ